MCFAVDPFLLRASPTERLFGMCNHRYARQLSNIEARERILSPVRANPCVAVLAFSSATHGHMHTRTQDFTYQQFAALESTKNNGE